MDSVSRGNRHEPRHGLGSACAGVRHAALAAGFQTFCNLVRPHRRVRWAGSLLFLRITEAELGHRRHFGLEALANQLAADSIPRKIRVGRNVTGRACIRRLLERFRHGGRCWVRLCVFHATSVGLLYQTADLKAPFTTQVVVADRQEGWLSG